MGKRVKVGRSLASYVRSFTVSVAEPERSENLNGRLVPRPSGQMNIHWASNLFAILKLEMNNIS